MKGASFPKAVAALQTGVQAAARGDLMQAIELFHTATRFAPDLAEAHYNLGTALKNSGRLEEALGHLRRAVKLRPDNAAARVNLGNLAASLRIFDEAITHLREGVRLNPKASAFANFGLALLAARRLGEAKAALRQAVALDSGLAQAWNGLGNVLQQLGESEGAIDAYRRAIMLKAEYGAAHSNLVQALCLSPHTTPADILAAAQAFANSCSHTARHEPPHPGPRDGRRLRLAYASGDLYTHPVGFFMAPLIAAHDRERFEVFVYDHGRRSDTITDDLRHRVEHWIDARGMDAAALADRVLSDRIDVLIDLAGHSGEHRLLTLARRPAALQGVAGGHFTTTGLPQVDFLVIDQWQAPPGAERHYCEGLVRMPHGYNCYRPPAYAPAVGPLPAHERGRVTFGCFNRLAKVNDAVLDVWARILNAVPGSRLLLVGAGYSEPDVESRLKERLRAGGVDPQRLDLRGALSHVQLLTTYNDIDVALDPFPYSGGLTTCEALWMGVPVVTLVGELFSGRHSLSHLANVGLPQFAAADRDAYIDIAVRLTANLPALAKLRAGLRDRVSRSPLCDIAGQARALEAALVGLWDERFNSRECERPD